MKNTTYRFRAQFANGTTATVKATDLTKALNRAARHAQETGTDVIRIVAI